MSDTLFGRPPHRAATHIGWWRPNPRGRWLKITEAESYDRALAGVLESCKGGDVFVTPASVNPNAGRPRPAAGPASACGLFEAARESPAGAGRG